MQSLREVMREEFPTGHNWDEPPSPRFDSLQDDIDEAALTAVVFAGIAAEAYIYDFGARSLGDTFMKKNLDSLSVPSKWIVIPRMAKGHVVSTDGQAFEALVLLVRHRNATVHHKSVDASAMPQDRLLQRFQWGKSLPERAEASIAALDVLAIEAEKFDPIWGPLSLGQKSEG